MNFGVTLPNFGAFGDVQTVGALAQLAEESGWDGVFIWDHLEFFGIEPCADPWVLMTAIALRTQRIRFGPAVTPLVRRHPGKLAREIATLDQLSQGRLIFGAGSGHPGLAESTAFGESADLRTRAEIADEKLEILCQWWAPGPVQFKGDHLVASIEVSGSTYQQPRVPIWLAATWPSRRPFRRAARWDGVAAQHRDVMQGAILSVEETRSIAAYTAQYRTSMEPFDIVHFRPIGTRPQTGEVDEYANAGSTWWIESAIPGSDRGAVEARLEQGPPS